MQIQRLLYGFLCLFSSLAIAATLTAAQEPPETTLRIHAGEIFEVLAFSSSPQNTYTWILEQDGDFIQAARGTFFQTRLTQAGNYALNAEAVDSQGMITRRKFQIEVSPPSGEPSAPVDETQLVLSEPPFDSSGRIIRQSDTEFFTLIPSRMDIDALIVDLNTSYDSNGDSFSDNDEDTVGTAFRAGLSRLHVWLVNPLPTQDIRVTGITPAGDSVTQNLTISSQSAVEGSGGQFFPPDASSGGSLSSIGGGSVAPGEFGQINATVEPTGAIRFYVSFNDFTAEDPLLLHWDFGDTGQSLLSSPVHRYANPGTYPIQVVVRDLRTGEELATLSTNVTVSGTDTSSSSVSDESSSSSEDTTTPVNGSSDGSLFGLIVKILIAFLIAGGIGALLMYFLSKLRKGKTLEQTFADAEENLLNTSGSSSVVDLPPLEISADEEEEQPSEPGHAALEPNPEQLETETENAPSWLKPGIERAEQKEYSAATPAPAELASEETRPQEPSSSEVSAQPLPDWLTPSDAQPEKASPPPPPPVEPKSFEPEPEAEPEQPPEQPQQSPQREEPAPKPQEEKSDESSAPTHEVMEPKVEELQTTKEEAPAWLQSGIAQAEQKGVSATTPEPEPAPEEVQEETVPKQEDTSTTEDQSEQKPQPKETSEQEKQQPATVTPLPLSPAEEERQRKMQEKRREKRRRYRENKKKRAVEEREEEKNDEGKVSETNTLASDQPEEASKAPDQTVQPLPQKQLAEQEKTEAPAQTKTPRQEGEMTPDEPIAYIRVDSIEDQRKEQEQGNSEKTA